MRTPLLSVCVITYNHASFIRQAIDSVLMQELDFTWEIIIADDCSTDGTREILLEYKAKYPDLIKLILQGENVGPSRNWYDLIYSTNSKYIAYLEGDDYWIDNKKLKTQYEHLENQPNINMCLHNAKLVNIKGDVIQDNIINSTISMKILDFNEIMNLPFPSSSIFFRNQRCVLDILFKSKDYYRLRLGDLELKYIFKAFGDIYYIDKHYSVYRKNANGLSNTNIFNQYSQIERFKIILPFLNDKDRNSLIIKIKSHYHYLFFIFFKKKEVKKILLLVMSYFHFAIIKK